MSSVTKIGGRRPPLVFIREWMEYRGLNQAQLASRMDTTAATVSRKLTTKRGMKLEDLAWFAEALDCSPGDLLRDPNRPSADELLRDASPAVRQQALTVIRALKTGTDG